MDPAVEMTVEKIHSSTVRIVLYLGGGASQVQHHPPLSLPPASSPCRAPAACCSYYFSSFTKSERIRCMTYSLLAACRLGWQ